MVSNLKILFSIKDALKGLFLLTSEVALELRLWEGYFIYCKFPGVFLYLMSLLQLKKKLVNK